MHTKILTLAQIEDLAYRALRAAGGGHTGAQSVAVATAATEADGVASHGLAYIPIYCEHIQCGKVNADATPTIRQPRPALIAVDAATGFAHPAIDIGFEHLVPLAKQQGLAGLLIHNSYNCGMLGYHTHRLAQAGLLGLGFTNAPASIAPSGGTKPVLGTNPFSIAVPGKNHQPTILIDQSASTIAKSEVMKHAREGQPIPLGWALDPQGNPTTDPQLALSGSMAPSGGYKGVAVALMVELLAAALSGASLGIHAAPFSGSAGGPPKTGQFFLAIDPYTSAGDCFTTRITELVDAFANQPGAHLPGDGRKSKRALAQRHGVAINLATLEKIQALLTQYEQSA